MNVSLEYFLLIVKEQSIARAAEKLYITPQNLSNHLKRLETKYGTLFLRTPHFQLTPAGEALVRAAQNLRAIENSLDAEIKAINGAESVTIRIGIHAARARMLLPMVMKTYIDRYPSARIIFSYKDVLTCIEMLKAGEIDAFLAIDCPPDPDFLEFVLEDEPTYFIASQLQLKENNINPFDKVIKIEDLDKFTYLLSPKSSRMRAKLDVFRRSNSLVLDERMVISDFETQLILTSQNLGACFVPKMFLPTVDNLNRSLPTDNKLFIFEIEKFELTSKISVITHKNAYRSRYLKGFIECIQEYYATGYTPQMRYKREEAL